MGMAGSSGGAARRGRSRVWLWILLLVLVGLGFGWWSQKRLIPTVESGTVLVVDLQGEYVDQTPNPIVARLLGRREGSLLSLLSLLAKAERDPRIHAVVLRIRDLRVGWGRAEEIRGAIQRLGKSGKHTLAQLEVEGFGNAEYFVASAAERISVTPASRNPFVGLAGEYLFLGGLFEKLGIQIEYERIGRYKSAVEAYAEKGMSEANREMSNSLLDSVEQRFVEAIAAARHLTPGQVRKAIDAGPTSPEEKRALGLVDEVAYFDEVRHSFGEHPILEAAEYAKVPAEDVGFSSQARFALITGEGPVLVGDGSVGRRGQPVMASGALAKAFASAADDPDIAAIIFRVDSPGGSAMASDLIWKAVHDAQAKGKKVVASFSDYAASGGYYAACGADRIVSESTTFTGSIGVFMLRPVLGGLMKKLGIGVVDLRRGAHADVLLSAEPLTPATRALVRRHVRGIYDLFVSRVAEGRSMPAEQVDAIARGRVWTGAQALDNGLVDSLGGLRDAVVEAKILVGLDPAADVTLVPFPPPKPLVEQLAQALGGAVHARAASALAAWLPSPARAWLTLLESPAASAPLLVLPGWLEVH